MSKIFVHYPLCVRPEVEAKLDRLVREHQKRHGFADKVEIYGMQHALGQIRAAENAKLASKATYALHTYFFYILLYILSGRGWPPSLRTMRQESPFREDRAKLEYHFKALDDCAAGIFVPHRNGLWPYDMWRNARRLVQKQKPVWYLKMDEQGEWAIHLLESELPRAVRTNRKQNIRSIGEHAHLSDKRSFYLWFYNTFLRYFDTQTDKEE